jgi:hypothetical protein
VTLGLSMSQPVPEPSQSPSPSTNPPANGKGKADALKTIGGLVAVAVGLVALTVIALVGMGFVKSDNPSVVSIATASFGVIGTVVGAYFGSKSSNDSTQKAIDGTQNAINAMRDEAAKAQTYAARLDPNLAEHAITDYHRLRGTSSPDSPD